MQRRAGQSIAILFSKIIICTIKYSTQCAWACQVFHYYFPLQHTICTIKYSIVQDCHVLHSQPVFLFYHCCSCHHLIILSSCHLVILSSCHLVIILSSYHLIILSSYHLIILSCHLVIILSSLLGLTGCATLHTTHLCTSVHAGFAKAHSSPHRASHVLHNRAAAALFLLFLVIALVVSLLTDRLHSSF